MEPSGLTGPGLASFYSSHPWEEGFHGHGQPLSRPLCHLPPDLYTGLQQAPARVRLLFKVGQLSSLLLTDPAALKGGLHGPFQFLVTRDSPSSDEDLLVSAKWPWGAGVTEEVRRYV